MTVDLEQIRARAEAATSGRWEAQCEPESYAEQPWTVVGLDADIYVAGLYLRADPGQQESDVEFIAYARQDILDLLAEVERLRAEVAEWRGIAEQALELLSTDDAARIVLRHFNSKLDAAVAKADGDE